MLTNREVFLNDPTTTVIPNDGTADVAMPSTLEQMAVLRWELASFVCEGEYLRGLELILSTYLGHLNEPKQPAVWVSGFYGSGKSHLARVLWALWQDLELPDGVTARGLVRLPADIGALLTELETAGRRAGGLWAAAGKMSSLGDNVPLSILGIVLASAGMPVEYPLTRFVLWLRQEGRYEAVKQAMAARGRSLERELANMYVSTTLAEALLDAMPDFAGSPAAAKELLKTQYPPAKEISVEEMVRTMEDVLELQSSTSGKLPCTLLVLDELQQDISESSERARLVRHVEEACASRFGSKLLFVGTGQSAIQGTPQLSQLQGRFTVRVTLSDKDIETVVRQVVLRKAPDKEPDLKAVLDRAAGEIDRQLAGSRIGPTLTDGADLVSDYPLLPARRRFWERLLRAVDSGGTGAQLRTQLRVVHDAVKSVAGEPLGRVIPADAIYGQLKGDMRQTGVLLRDVENAIQDQDDGTPDGVLRSRLCAAVFLVGKLPTDGPAATGLTATAETLADLLVEDVNTGSPEIRSRVPELLQKLVEAGTLMQVGDEYRLQTKESAEWEADFRRRAAQIRSDDSRVASDRSEELRTAVEAALKGLSLTQGASKTARKVHLHFGADTPIADGGTVPVWVRDEWSVTEKTVRQDAQAAGMESPVIFVSLPRKDSDALRARLAAYEAAKETVEARVGQAKTPEAIEAQKAMESRRDIERKELDDLIAGILASMKLFQGGGNEVVGLTPKDAVLSAARDSLARLFPKFDQGDSAFWDRVFQRTSQGASDALSAVGYTGDAEKHPVCAEVRAFVGAAGKKGSDVRRHFAGSPWGWPQDAVDAALLVLVGAGSMRASAKNGVPVGVKEIQRQQIGTTDFDSEGVAVTMPQKIAVRKLLADLGIPFKTGEEAEAIPLALEKLATSAKGAGGDPPLPERPSAATVEKLKGMSGNERFVAVYEAREGLLSDFQSWTKAAEKAAGRLPRWLELLRLLDQAKGRGVYGQVKPQADAVREGRTLLQDPDPLPPLQEKLATLLRSELQSVRKRLEELRDREMAALEASSEWTRLQESQRERLVREHGLGPVPELKVATDEALLATLDDCALAEWGDRVVALPARFARAREAAARLLEPKAVRVSLPTATLKSAGEVDDYLASLRGRIMPHIEAGSPVILSPWKGDGNGAAAE